MLLEQGLGAHGSKMESSWYLAPQSPPDATLRHQHRHGMENKVRIRSFAPFPLAPIALAHLELSNMSQGQCNWVSALANSFIHIKQGAAYPPPAVRPSPPRLPSQPPTPPRLASNAPTPPRPPSNPPRSRAPQPWQRSSPSLASRVHGRPPAPSPTQSQTARDEEFEALKVADLHSTKRLWN